MKLTLLLLISQYLCFSVFAGEETIFCSVRMNEKLAISVSTSLDDFMSGNQFEARLNFDDLNRCYRSKDGSMTCTEIAAPDYLASFRDVTPKNTQGSVHYKISKLLSYDPSSYEPSESALEFADRASFYSRVLPDPNLTVVLNGKDYEMNCNVHGVH